MPPTGDVDPSGARATAHTRVRLEPGLTCRIAEGPWRLAAGMAEELGGANAGPSPGVLVRGALGSCLALGYALWAARLGVTLGELTVDVYADYDSRGEPGVAATVPPGYTQVRYVVTVDSPADASRISHVLDTADQHSQIRDVFARGQDMRREVRLVRR